MIEQAGMEFAQVRLQVMYAARPHDNAWRELEAARGLAAFTEISRKVAFRQLAGTPEVAEDVHVLEAALRARWRANVARIASWLPGKWQPVLHWCASLPELAFIDHLLRGRAAPDWLRVDSVLGGLAAGDAAQRRAALGAGPLAPLAAPGASIPELWRAELLRRMHGADAAERRIDVLVRAMCSGDDASAGSAAARLGPIEDGQSRLRAIFRGAGNTPVAALALLALLAQDFRRFRGQLARRAALPNFHPVR